MFKYIKQKLQYHIGKNTKLQKISYEEAEEYMKTKTTKFFSYMINQEK